MKFNHFKTHGLKYISFIFLFVLVAWGLDSSVDEPDFRPFSGQLAQEESVMSVKKSFSSPRVAAAGLGGGISNILVSSADAKEAVSAEKKIIKNASVSLEASDPEIARFEIKKILEEKFKGEILNMNSWQVRPEVLGYHFSAKVPAESLTKALEELSTLGQKTAESINVSDITESYADTENRIKNLKIRRDRLREMLETETEKLADILSVDRELSSVQNQIENLERTQVRRDDQVTFSRIEISLSPKTQIGDANSPYWSLENSWTVAVNNLIQKSRALLDGVLKIIVLAPFWLVGLLIIWYIRKRFFSRRK